MMGVLPTFVDSPVLNDHRHRRDDFGIILGRPNLWCELLLGKPSGLSIGGFILEKVPGLQIFRGSMQAHGF